MDLNGGEMSEATRRDARSVMSFLKGIYQFYIDGFRSMTIGRKLWWLILIKIFILFFIFKLFFFPDLLKRDYDNDTDRAAAVRKSLIDR